MPHKSVIQYSLGVENTYSRLAKVIGQVTAHHHKNAILFRVVDTGAADPIAVVDEEEASRVV